MIWLHGIQFGELRSSNYVCLAAPLLDLAGISTEFCGAISTWFCFSYSLEASLLCRAGYTLGSATHFC